MIFGPGYSGILDALFEGLFLIPFGLSLGLGILLNINPIIWAVSFYIVLFLIIILISHYKYRNQNLVKLLIIITILFSIACYFIGLIASGIRA